jgi:hypothetical protein
MLGAELDDGLRRAGYCPPSGASRDHALILVFDRSDRRPILIRATSAETFREQFSGLLCPSFSCRLG